MLTTLVYKPELRFIAADWLIQALFVFMGKRAKNYTCIHFQPTILEHGSLTAKYSSSIRDGYGALSTFS